MPGVGRVLGWFLLVGLLGVQVWGLYLLVPGTGEPYFAGQDKVAHALLFGLPFGLALLLRATPVALAVVGHALVSEPLQGLLTVARTADPWDAVADLTGIALAGGLVLLVRHRATRSALQTRESAGVAT